MSRSTKSRRTSEWTPKYMGNRKPFDGLDAIPLQSGKALASVTLTSDEVTALCPLTGQPDFYTVKIQYRPKKFLVESKSVKLWLQSYQNKGIFAEGLAIELAERFNSEIRPYDADITVTQKSRGGVTLVATAYVTDSGIDF